MPPTNDDRDTVELDGRGRASLTKYAAGRRHFLIDVDPKTGVITLEPAVVMPLAEYNRAHGPVRIPDEDPLDRPEAHRERLYKLIVEEGRPMNINEIFTMAVKAGYTTRRATVTDWLAGLVIGEYLTQPDRGVYAVNPDAPWPPDGR